MSICDLPEPPSYVERCVHVMPTGRPGRFSMTPRLREAYDAIIAHFDEHGRSPNFDELAAALNLRNRSSVHFLIGGLQERFWLTFNDRQARSISLIEPVMRFPRAA